MSTAPTGTSSPTIGRSRSASRRAIGTPRVRMPDQPQRRPLAPTLGDPARHRLRGGPPSLGVAEARFRLVHGLSLRRRSPSGTRRRPPDRSNHQPIGRKRTRRPATAASRDAVFPPGAGMLTISAYRNATGPEARPAMKIILANPRGFCAGVNMAIESLERSLEFFGAPALRLSRDRP